LAELATEPAWLEERRQKGAALVGSLPLPDHKVKGWEFTDLASLDLDSYTGASAAVEVSGGEGATVVSLAEAVESHAELLREALGSLVPVEIHESTNKRYKKRGYKASNTEERQTNKTKQQRSI